MKLNAVARIAVAISCAVLTACTGSSAGTSASHGAAEPSARTGSSAHRPTSASAADAASAVLAAARPTARWAHVVVVVEENHSYSDIIGNRAAPFLNSLARRGASFTHFFAERHPSEPNYLALFSGSTHGLHSDACPLHYAGTNLGSTLRSTGRSFAGYSEGLPRTGFTGCTSGAYVRRHVPWVNFTNLPGSVNRPLSAFPRQFAKLPRISFVIPNLNHDMHDGTIAMADSWLRTHLGGYANWARAHRSLLVVTWDEDDRSEANRIPTIALGSSVKHGPASERLNHYRLLRTLEDAFGLRHPGLGRVRGIPQLGG